MRIAIVGALCLVFAFGPLARADLEAGTYAPDIEAKEWANTDEPISLAECRGMVVVLFFWVSWHAGGEYVMPLMTLVNSSPYGRRRGVFLIGLTDAARERVEETLKKELVAFPVGFESDSVEDYQINSFPRVVIIDAEGKVAWTGWPGQDGGNKLIEEISRVVGETPPTKTHPELAVAARAHLKQARSALREDDYAEAYEDAREAFDNALVGDPLKTRCQDMLDLIEALGRDKLARAERAVDQREFEEAVTLLREIKREFKGADIARTATKRLRSLRQKHDEVKTIIEQLEDSQWGEALLAKAMQTIRDGEFGEGYEMLQEILTEYGTTDAADKAQTIIERMEKNEGIMGYVRDYTLRSECLSLLSQAESFERSGKSEKARALYRQVIDACAGTIYEHDAIKRLRQLP